MRFGGLDNSQAMLNMWCDKKCRCSTFEFLSKTRSLTSFEYLQPCALEKYVHALYLVTPAALKNLKLLGAAKRSDAPSTQRGSYKYHDAREKLPSSGGEPDPRGRNKSVLSATNWPPPTQVMNCTESFMYYKMVLLWCKIYSSTDLDEMWF